MAPRSDKKGNPRKFQSKVPKRELIRREALRTVGKTVLIVCEDAKSSTDYFKKLRSKLNIKPVKVEVCGEECGSDPRSVVNYANKRKDAAVISPVGDKYDETFCVIDIDKHQADNLNAAIQKARDNDIDLIISNPCFEYWYVLHFKKTGSAYNHHRDAQREFRDILRLEFNDKRYEYNKSGCQFFNIIYPKTGTAIDNSRSILKSQHKGETDLSKCNPSTHVHRIAECMMEMAEKTNEK
ncbi:MAG: RloB domain-containing protein [Planctomycetes bacterium]|nr:RloB domain-containing protein [Planctomycetota bacterium]